MTARELVQLLHRALESDGLVGVSDAVIAELAAAVETRDVVLLCDGPAFLVNGDDSASELLTARTVSAQFERLEIRRLQIERGSDAGALARLVRVLRGGERPALERHLGDGSLARVRVEFTDRAVVAAAPAPVAPPGECDGAAMVPRAVVPDAVAAIGGAGRPTPSRLWEVPEDPDAVGIAEDAQRDWFERTFARLTVSRERLERIMLFDELVHRPGIDVMIVQQLGHRRRYVVLLGLALISARGHAVASPTITTLFLEADRSVKLACLRTLQELKAGDRWLTFQVGLKDSDPAIRIACLEAFDAEPQRLAPDLVRAMLARERDDGVLVALAVSSPGFCLHR